MSTPPDRTDRLDLPEHGLRVGPARARVLSILRDLPAPATAADVAGRLGGHANTARFHLEALVAAGVVERHREDRTAPGRPRTHYALAATAGVAPQRSYRILAEILASHVASTSPDPAAEAAQAGRDFARHLVPEGARADTPAVAAEVVAAQLAGLGFDSRPAPDPHGARLDVRSCPFLEVATGHLDVVCSVHRGLMEGLLAGIAAPVEVTSLEPLVAPGHCVARLRLAERRGQRVPRRSPAVPAR